MARESLHRPSDWTTSLLDEVTQRGSGHTPDKSKPGYWNGGIKWVSLADSSNLDHGFIDKTDKEISADGLAHSSAVLHPKGTVIMSRDAGVGKSAVLGEEMAVSQHFIAWRCDSPGQLHNWFLYYWLQLYKREFERMAVGSTIKTIGLPYFKKLRISCPRYSEQRRIAETIATWDRAIGGVEKLIKNSERQKIALMEDLLPRRGNTDAIFYQLSDIGTTYGGLTGKTKDDFGDGSPYIPYNNVFQNSRFDPECVDYVSVKPNEKQHKVQYGDIIVTTSSETPDEVGMTSVVLDKVDDLYLNSFCFGFRLKDFTILLPEYARYLFRSSIFRRDIYRLAQGSTRYNLAKTEFLKLRLPLPPLEQQERVAQVLAVADKGTAGQTDMLAALRKEKTALMQQLLTGKRRVRVGDTTESAYA